MSPADPDRARWQTVLRLGPAIAVLIQDAPAEVAARDALASASLQQATGQRDIVIRRRPSGRPCLAPPHGELGVSMARRGSVLLAGFCADAAVGVDLEINDRADQLDPVRLARDHFARDEAEAVAALPADAARDLFLSLWVAKEAVLKATGRGVFDGLLWPNLAMQVAALRTGGAVVDGAAEPGSTVKIAVTTLAPAYCALAMIGPGNRP